MEAMILVRVCMICLFVAVINDGLWMYCRAISADEGHWIVGREVKCDDPDWTNGSESCALRRMSGSRTKAGGSKSIRYRFSSSSKRCRLDVTVWVMCMRN